MAGSASREAKGVDDSRGAQRVSRSAASSQVNATLENLLRRNVIRHVELGKTRLGRMSHRILGCTGHSFRFVLDLDAEAVLLPSFLPAPLPPRLLRELNCCLRRGMLSADTNVDWLDAHRGELRVFVRHGAATLSITVKNGAYEYCVTELLRLGEEILTTHLSQPAYRIYRARCFDTHAKSDAICASPP